MRLKYFILWSTTSCIFVREDPAIYIYLNQTGFFHMGILGAGNRSPGTCGCCNVICQMQLGVTMHFDASSRLSTVKKTRYSVTWPMTSPKDVWKPLDLVWMAGFLSMKQHDPLVASQHHKMVALHMLRTSWNAGWQPSTILQLDAVQYICYCLWSIVRNSSLCCLIQLYRNNTSAPKKTALVIGCLCTVTRAFSAFFLKISSKHKEIAFSIVRIASFLTKDIQQHTSGKRI